MALIGTVPRRCVNLPPGTLRTLLASIFKGRLVEGPDLERFYVGFGEWLGVPHVFGGSSGRSAFQLALESLDLPPGSEIVFPAFTFPVMPMVAKVLGFKPVFCSVDPETYNAGPEHIAPVLTENTSAVLATHLFGRPCPIEAVAALAQERGVRLVEDCAHGLGVRVGGRQVGTFGDVGMFSFAEGKNMPCLGGGAIATADEAIAARARAIQAAAKLPDKDAVRSKAVSIWIKWLVTRPLVFGLTAYQVLRLKQMLGKPLMDFAVGDELVGKYLKSNPSVSRLANLQAAVGLLQLQHIDAFNQGARRNAEILTEALGEVPGVGIPSMDPENVYVYYPLAVDAAKRDDLRHTLLRHGIDTKLTDMSDCAKLEAFRDDVAPTDFAGKPTEATLIEICVYPSISQRQMRHIARVIRAWAPVNAGIDPVRDQNGSRSSARATGS